MSVVSLTYESLLKGEASLPEKIFEAYGPGGLGALVISGIPNYVEERAELLKFGPILPSLSKEVLSSLENPKSLWNSGWSMVTQIC